MARFIRSEIWTDWQGAGGQPLGAVQFSQLSVTRSLDGSQNQLEAVMPARGRNAALVRVGRVVRLVYDDGSFLERRIHQRPRRKNGDLSIVAKDPRADLYEDCVVVEFDGITGLARDGGGANALTMTQWVDNYVIAPRVAEGSTWLQRGTIDPTISFAFTWDDTPSSGVMLDRLVERARQLGVACEVQLRRNGTAGYYVDILTAIGATLPTRVLRYGGALRDPLVETQDRREQATRVIVRGKDAATMARARWKITAIDAFTRKVTLADPAGGVGPIAFDDQFVNWYLYREATGGTFKIQDSWTGTQQAQLELLTTLAVGECVQLRMTEPESGSVYYRIAGTHPDARGIVLLGTPAGPDTLDLSDAFGGGGGDPVPVDGMLVDRHLTFATQQVVARSMSPIGAVGAYGARFSLVGGTAGIDPGDWLFNGSANTLPTAPFAPWGVVVAKDAAAPGEVEVVRLDDGTTDGLVYTGGASWAYTYRPALFGGPVDYWRIVNSVAATNRLTVDTSVKSIPPGTPGAVRIMNRLGLGKRPLWVAHPTRDKAPALGGYGPKIANLDRPLIAGTANRVPNAFMRTWSVGINPPDGWTLSSGSLLGRQLTDPLYTQLGGKSWMITAPGLLSGSIEVARTPLIPFTPGYAGHTWSTRLRLMIRPNVSRPWSGDQYFKLELWGVKADGSLIAGSVAAYAVPPNTDLSAFFPGGIGDDQRMGAEQWIDLVVNGFDAGALGAACVGLKGILSWSGNGSGPAVGYFPPVVIDGVMADDVAEISSEFEEFGTAAALHQAGNRGLAVLSDIPISLQITPEDMNAIDPAAASTAVGIGQLVRVIADDIDQTARVQLIREQLLPHTRTPQQVTIATRPPLFTDLAALS